ncbi:MAG: hypothetical protein ABWY00_16530 [Dongiaceae bacterium]
MRRQGHRYEYGQAGYRDRAGDRPAAGIGEIGCIVVLTRLLAGPVRPGSAVEEIAGFAAQLAWQPVGDVLRAAIERGLERRHIGIDRTGQLVLARSGRSWLVSALSHSLAATAVQIAEPVMACKLCLSVHLDGAARRQLLADMIAHRQRFLPTACDDLCRAETRDWQAVTEARLSAEMRGLDALLPRQPAGQGRN